MFHNERLLLGAGMPLTEGRVKSIRISDSTSTRAQLISPSNGPFAPAKSILILPSGTLELEGFHSLPGFIGVVFHDETWPVLSPHLFDMRNAD